VLDDIHIFVLSCRAALSVLLDFEVVFISTYLRSQICKTIKLGGVATDKSTCTTDK